MRRRSLLSAALILAFAGASASGAQALANKSSPQPSHRPPLASPSSRASSKIPPALRKVQDKYAKAGTLTAHFTQVTESAALHQKKTSNGLILVKRPNKVRWETLKPDPNLLVSDGKTFWFYTPPFEEDEPGQVIVRPASQIQSRLANALLAGKFSSERGLKIRQKSPTHFVLTPKKGTAGSVERAEVEIDPKKDLIKKVILHNRGGNTSAITLSDIQLGQAINEALFHFVPPPNTERVK